MGTSRPASYGRAQVDEHQLLAGVLTYIRHRGYFASQRWTITMAKNQSISLCIAVAMLGWAPLAFSATSASGASHNRHHVPEPPETPAVALQGNPELDAQIAHLRAIRERLSRANTPEERQALLTERTQVMQDVMATMHKTVGMPMMAGMRPPKGKSKDMTAQMQMCHGMMGQNMALMQEMMQSMMDGQGMGGGMGMGSGMGSMMPK
jgi:hypothetical protein